MRGRKDIEILRVMLKFLSFGPLLITLEAYFIILLNVFSFIVFTSAYMLGCGALEAGIISLFSQNFA